MLTIPPENIMLEPEVMRHYGREDLGVAIPEGGGYIGTLNIYHELHCIVRLSFHSKTLDPANLTKQKRLYQYSYQDYYWSDLTDQQREINRLHNGEPIHSHLPSCFHSSY